MKQDVAHAAEALLRRCSVDRSIRTLAHSRLRKKEGISHISVTILSCSVIALGVAQLVVKNILDGNLPGGLTFMDVGVTTVNMIASIMIVVISLHEHGHRYDLRAEKMSVAARELDDLYYRMSRKYIGDELTESDVERYWNEYRKVQSDASELHNPVDVHYYECFEQNVVAYNLNQDLNISMEIISVDRFAKVRSLLARFASIYASMIWFVFTPGTVFFAIVQAIEALARVN